MFMLREFLNIERGQLKLKSAYMKKII